MGQKIALIIAGAPHHQAFALAPYAKQADFVICADHGYDYANQQGIAVDLFVGDGDSCQKMPENCQTVVLPAVKDDTDTLYAVKTALARGFTSLMLVCATGGRIDHMLCNLSLCEYVHAQGAHLTIADACNRIQLLHGQTVTLVKSSVYKYFSIIPLDAVLHGVTIKGAAYPLCNASVSRNEIYSVSNETIDNFVQISVLQGRALLVESCDAQ